MRQSERNPWTVKSERKVYGNPWIELTEYGVINPAGGEGIYGKVHFRNHAIGIVPMDEHGDIWLVGQYRFPLDSYSWEIPEGGCPIGNDTLEAARRELREETGLVAQHWEKLLEMHLSNSVSDEFGIVYLATGLEQHDPEPEDTEELSVRKIPLEEAMRMVDEHRITDSLSVAAIQRMWIRRLENRRHVQAQGTR